MEKLNLSMEKIGTMQGKISKTIILKQEKAMFIFQYPKIFTTCHTMARNLLRNRLLLFIAALSPMFFSCTSDTEKCLFIPEALQDSLSMFIKKNSIEIENPFGAPTICNVTIDEYEDEIHISFMAYINLIEEVAIDDNFSDSLIQLQGACRQNGMVVVIYADKRYPELVDYTLLNLERSEYDFFYSQPNTSRVFDFYPISYRSYSLNKNNELNLNFMRKSRYELP